MSIWTSCRDALIGPKMLLAFVQYDCVRAIKLTRQRHVVIEWCTVSFERCEIELCTGICRKLYIVFRSRQIEAKNAKRMAWHNLLVYGIRYPG